MLSSFRRIILKFEDAMRQERERRTEPDWTFTKYFMLQVWLKVKTIIIIIFISYINEAALELLTYSSAAFCF